MAENSSDNRFFITVIPVFVLRRFPPGLLMDAFKMLVLLSDEIPQGLPAFEELKSRHARLAGERLAIAGGFTILFYALPSSEDVVSMEEEMASMGTIVNIDAKALERILEIEKGAFRLIRSDGEEGHLLYACDLDAKW